jgi:hypothetical protein
MDIFFIISSDNIHKSYLDYTLNHLVKYVNYEVKIIAFNSIGDGPASTITSVYVGEA